MHSRRASIDPRPTDLPADVPAARGDRDASPSHEVTQAFGTALLIREVEQKLLALFAAGKLYGTVHTCIGQEFAGVSVARALESGDFVISNHRCHGHFLARTDDVDGLIAEVMGRQSGVCGGRGGSQHLCDYEHGFFSNGVLGGTAPVAAGMAMAQRFRGQGRIAALFLGDGTLGEGVLYESLNIASKWELPLLFVLENNRYAQSTPSSQTVAGSMTARAEAFGIAARQASTWEPAHLMETAAECVAQVRKSGKPVFLVVDTYRLMAHSKGDDDRDPREIAAYWEKDPLARYLSEQPDAAAPLIAEARSRVEAAVIRAEASPYAARSEGLSTPAAAPAWLPCPVPGGDEDRVVTRIRDSLARNMKRDSSIVLIGEDIESPYGGAFKVTKGLSDEFPGRVRNTPISEAAIVGLGNGLALAGYRPVCEIMFGDFLTLAADQIVNHASKFPYMYNEQAKLPLVIRTPMGGRRGYGPTHSQSLEKHFLGLPQTRMLALHHRYDPGLVYDHVLKTADVATLVIENKLLYGMRLGTPVPEGFVLERTDEATPFIRLRPLAPPEITVFCYGGMLTHVEQAVARAFDEDEIVAEVIAPLQLYPFDIGPVLESLGKTGRLLVVEEGLSFAALGAELVARVAESAPGSLKQVRRLGPPEHPIPCSGPLENELLPDAGAVHGALRALAGHA